MDKYAGLASLFDPSVGSGDAALDELIGIRPYTAKEQEEDKRRELADIETYMGGEAGERVSGSKMERAAALAPIYEQAANRWGVDPSLVMAVHGAESAFIPGRTSTAGAYGLGQFMPDTWKRYGHGDQNDPRAAADATAHYLSDLLKRFGGDERLAVAAYNAGEGNVQKYGGVPPFKETQNYVPKVLGARDQYSSIISGGRQSPQYPQLETTPMQLSTGQTINVEKGMTHAEVAAMLKKEGIEGVPLRQFQAPNGQTVNAEYDMSDDEVLGMLRKEAPEYATPQGAPTPNKSSYGAAAKESLLTSGAGIFTGLGGETKELGKAVAGTELLGQYAKPVGEAITGAGESMRGYGEELGHRAEGVFEMPKDASWFEKNVGYPIVQTGAGVVPYAAAYAIPGVGPVTGTAALYGGAMGGLEERAKETGKEFVPSEARPYAVGETALDYVGGRLLGPLKKLFSDDVVLGARETIIKAVEKGGIEEAKKLVGSRLGNIAKQVGITDAAFTSSEVAENVIERAYAGQPLFDDSALQEYADTAKQVAGFGGVAGVAQGLGRHHIKATEVARIEEQKATEEALAAQEKAQLAQQTALEEQAVAKAEKRKKRQPIEIPEKLQSMPYKEAVRYMQMQEAKAQPVAEETPVEAPVEEVPEPTVQEKPYYEQLGLKARKNSVAIKGLKELNPDNPAHGPTINALLDAIEAKKMPRDQQAIDALRTKLNEVQQNAQQVSETGPTDGSGSAQPSVLEEGGDQTVSGEGVEPSRQGEQDVEVDDEEPTEKVKAVAEEVPTGEVDVEEEDNPQGAGARIAKGLPLVSLVRGDATPGIERFTPTTDGLLGQGIYFTEHTEAAKGYGPHVTRSTVRLRNPLVIDGDKLPSLAPEHIVEAIAKHPSMADYFWTPAQARRWARQQVEDWAGIGDEEFPQMLRDAGHDGVVLLKDGKVMEATALHPGQVHATTPEETAKAEIKAVAEEVPTGMVNPREFMHYKDVTKRTAELTQAAEQLAAGEITKEDYAALVNKYKPVTAYRSIPKPASLEEMHNALSKDKVDKIGEASGTLEEGENIGLRLDIPAYRDHGAWVVTVHTPRRGGFAGKPIGYESVAGATDVSFGITEKAALNIAKGSGKATIATMEGKWKPVSPEEAATLGKQYLNDPEWIQVGMDPERHSYFYDRANMEPVTHAEEVLQIGGLVFAKNPTYAPASKFLFSGRGKNPDKGVLSLPIQEFESATDAKDLLNRYVKIATDSRLHDLAKTYLTSPHIGAAKVTFFKQGDKIPRNVKNAFDAAKAGAVTVVGEDGAHLYFKADDPNVFREDNVIHEVTHALTEAALVRNPSARAELTGLSDKISRVLHSNNPKYGKFWDDIIGKDPSETLAYSLTLPSFRQVLSKYDEDGHRLKAKPAAFKGQAPVRTLWQKFVDTLTRLFGLPSKQKQAYDTALNEYLDRKAEYEKQVADYNAQRPMQARLDSILQELLKTTAAEGVAMPSDTAVKAVKEAPRTERGLAGKLKDKDFGEKLSEAARDVLTSGRHTSLRSEWLDQSEALGKVTENLPTMVGKKARVDFLASHFAQVGNVIADSIHNGFVKDVGDGSVMTIKDHSLAPEKIFRRVAETGKKELFNEMLVALRGRSIREADIKTKALADDLLTKADELDDYASTLQDKKKRASFTRSAQNLRTIAEKKLEGINYERGRTEVSEEDIRKAEALERAEPELAREAQNLYELLRKCVDMLENSGLLDAETAKLYREYPNYIPLYKEQDFEEAMIDPKKHIELIISKMGRGANKLPEIKRQKAHFHEVMVESNILKHIALCTMTVAKNNLNKAAALQMELVGAAEPSKLGKNDPDAVQFRDKGEVKYYTIKDKQALFALQAAQPLINPIFKQLKKVSGVVRGAMVMNPLFWYRQLVREPLTASLVGRTGIVTPFDTLAEITKIAAGKSKRYEDLKRRGIVAAQDVITDPIEFIKYVEKGKGWTTKGIERIKEIHEAVDGATRAVVAERAYQDAISKGLSEEDANNLAAIKAREIINFSKQGRSQNVRVMRATTPFFGAALNGLDVLMKAAMPRKYGRLSKAEAMEARRMFYSRASMIALYTTAYAMASSDDEDYLSTVDRAGNWLVPIGNKDNPFAKISIPYELGFFIKTLPELITLMNMGAISTKKAVTEAGKAAWETVVPPMPTIYAIKPLVEAFINFDFHTQSPIETGSDSRGMIHLKNKKAGELTKAVASKLHDAGIDLETLSPDRMEHMLSGYFGQIWAMTRAASDYALYDGPEKPEKILSDYPLIGGAVTKGARDAAVNDFYTVYGNVRDLAESVSKAGTGGDIDTLEKLREDKNYAKYMRANTPLGDKMQAMDTKMQIIARIEKDTTIDAAEKKRRIDIQNEQRNTIAKQGLDIARKLGLEF